ncbi:MAG: histidinol-phosphatase, partial [Alistipes sp.]|nr:histidinol-phosphatase [Alistipes sp.]
MKRIYLLLALVCFGCANVVAQKNPDTFVLGKNTTKRVEMILPQVNGYNIYKADLHSHTAFSDGSLMPKARVLEAYNDGLDIL